MNPLGYDNQTEESWLFMIKKEMLDNRKSKEAAYNFNFLEDKAGNGKLIWEVIQDHSQRVTKTLNH